MHYIIKQPFYAFIPINPNTELPMISKEHLNDNPITFDQQEDINKRMRGFVNVNFYLF